MKSAKKLSLIQLMRSNGAEIDQLTRGIRGVSGSVLWTAEMRAATRGGKCTLANVDEPSDTE
ncbi:MAG TPA: hypothetical protein VKV03_10775 [Candidatus Binataceae bacterium]|nr:hypothetical protein [Candidatus Binataceae bacterium]